MNTCIYDSRANKLSIKTNPIKIKRVRESDGLDKLNSKHIVHKHQQSTESISVLDNKNNKIMLKRSRVSTEKQNELNIKMNKNHLIKSQMKLNKNPTTQSPVCWFAFTKKIYKEKLSYRYSDKKSDTKIRLNKKMKTFDHQTEPIVKTSSHQTSTKLVDILEQDIQEIRALPLFINKGFDLSMLNEEFEQTFLLCSTTFHTNTHSKDVSNCSSCVNSCDICKEKETCSESFLSHTSEFEHNSYLFSSTPVTFDQQFIQNQQVSDEMIKKTKKDTKSNYFKKESRSNFSKRMNNNLKSKRSKRNQMNEVKFIERSQMFKQIPRTSSSIELHSHEKNTNLELKIKTELQKNFMFQNSFTNSTVRNENFNNLGDFLVWYV